MGPGEVWVHDVQLFDLAFNESELRALYKLLTLADLNLQNGQVGDCMKLLNGYWPRFLMQNVPLPPACRAGLEAGRRHSSWVPRLFRRQAGPGTIPELDGPREGDLAGVGAVGVPGEAIAHDFATVSQSGGLDPSLLAGSGERVLLAKRRPPKNLPRPLRLLR